MSEVNSKWNNWIEEAVSKKHIKHYEYKHFKNIHEIGIGGFGKVSCANWKNSHQYFALKSLNFAVNEVAIDELIREVITKCIYVYSETLPLYMYFWLKIILL